MTANRAEVAHPEIAKIAKRHKLNAQQVVFAYAIAVGMLPLTGTKDSEHMLQDLAVLERGQLEPEDVRRIETIGFSERSERGG